MVVVKDSNNWSGTLVLRLVKMSSTKLLYNFGFLGGKMAPFSSFVMKISENTTDSGPPMCVLRITYGFSLTSGFMYSAITWAALYVLVSVCAIIGRNFSFSLVIMSEDANVCVFTVPYSREDWFSHILEDS